MMVSEFDAERRAIEQRFIDNFTAVDRARIRLGPPGVTNFTQPTDGNWVGIQILSGDQVSRSIGTGSTNVLRRWAGVIQVDIFTPENTGEGKAREIADAASAIFPDTTSIVIASGHTITPRSRSYVARGVMDAWFRAVLSVNYWRSLIA